MKGFGRATNNTLYNTYYIYIYISYQEKHHLNDNLSLLGIIC